MSRSCSACRREGIQADKSTTKGSSVLVSKRSFKDFELYAEFWADHDTNSGLYTCQKRLPSDGAGCVSMSGLSALTRASVGACPYRGYTHQR